MRNRPLLTFLAVAALSLGVSAAQSGSGDFPTDNDVNSIAKKLYCPVCPNTPLDVCETKACQDWRAQIKSQLTSGWSEDQIIDYFIEQYGERVLAEPRVSGFTGLVWLLPVVGLIWTPRDEVRWELIFPRPRIMWRWGCQGWTEDWLYLAGEFGGGSWAVQRSGVPDQITVRDYRVLLGLERKSPSGAGRRIEFGYVFGRVVEFTSATPDYEPDSALLLRAGWTY